MSLHRLLVYRHDPQKPNGANEKLHDDSVALPDDHDPRIRAAEKVAVEKFGGYVIASSHLVDGGCAVTLDIYRR